MAQVNLTGVIKSIGKTADISASFKKREMVLTERTGTRDQHIMIEFTQDRVGLLDSFQPGEEVSVTAFVNGREWTAKDGTVKYFLSLSANRIERVGAAAPVSAAGNGAPPPPDPADMSPASDEDDLPF